MWSDLIDASAVISASVAIGVILTYCGHAIHHYSRHRKPHAPQNPPK